MHMIKDSKVLKKFISKYLEKIYNKFSSMDKQELERIEAFVARLEEGNIDFDPYEDYVFYFDYGIDRLEMRAKEILEDNLEDVDKLADMYSVYERAEMWIFQTDTREAGQEYLVYNGWMDILHFEDLGRAFYDKYGYEIQKMFEWIYSRLLVSMHVFSTEFLSKIN